MKSVQGATIHVGGDGVEVSRNIVDGGFGNGALTVAGEFASVHNNVLMGGVDYAVSLVNDFLYADLHNNVILNGIGASPGCEYSISIRCNLVNGTVSVCPYWPDNFTADPLFCSESSYYLRHDSPCAPGNHPDGANCGLIGPLPVACGPVHIEAKTWGAVKAIYR
jgi:hypothetical protein